ncbi:MAG TPA: MFS transporter [bacterium]|jgi:MFS family permease|nr:MFS transporter [bacterium]
MHPATRNTTLGIIHECLWGAALGFINPLTILPLAAHDLGRSVTDAGLLEASLFAGLNVVQLGAAFVFPPAWTDPKKTAWMHAPALCVTLATAVTLALPLGNALHWTLLLWLVTAHWICLGLVVPHWATLSSRNIPDERLGRYFGWCFSASGLAMVFTGALAARLAAQGGVAWGYAGCFGAAFVIQTVSVWLLALTRPLKPPPDPTPPLKAFLKARWRQFGREKIFLGFGVIIVLLQFASGSTQLFTSFVKDQGCRTADFELFNPALAVGATLGSVCLGWIMDRHGPRPALALGLLPLLAGLAALGFGHGAWGSDALGFLCAGVFSMVFGSVMLPWMLRLAEPGQHITYMGLYSTLTAPWNFLAPFLLGRLAARYGYGSAFGVSAAAVLAMLLALAFLPRAEPRAGTAS